MSEQPQEKSDTQELDDDILENISGGVILPSDETESVFAINIEQCDMDRKRRNRALGKKRNLPML